MKSPILYALALLSAMAFPGRAGEPLGISPFTIDGGGATYSSSADGRFILSGTIGQPDAGPGAAGMTGGAFTLTGGFWFESPSGDCNGNGVVDLNDHAAFVDCMTALEDIGPGPGCECYDVDGDEIIGMGDFAVNQRSFVGND